MTAPELQQAKRTSFLQESDTHMFTKSRRALLYAPLLAHLALSPAAAQPTPPTDDLAPCRIGLLNERGGIRGTLIVVVANIDCPVGTSVEVTAMPVNLSPTPGISTAAIPLSWTTHVFRPAPGSVEGQLLEGRSEGYETEVALSITRCNGGPCDPAQFDVYPRRRITQPLRTPRSGAE